VNSEVDSEETEMSIEVDSEGNSEVKEEEDIAEDREGLTWCKGVEEEDLMTLRLKEALMCMEADRFRITGAEILRTGIGE